MDVSIQRLFDLSGRAALITGARGYLGRALADALAEAGARVVVSSRQDTAREILVNPAFGDRPVKDAVLQEVVISRGKY